MNDVDLLIKESHKEEFARWKETILFLYGAAYAEKFCSFDTFKLHLWGLGLLEAKPK